MKKSADDNPWAAMFADPDAVARYVEGPPRFMPGYHDVQRMAGVLLAEHVPSAGHVLVLGAGGGLEIKTLGQDHPSWRFTGVDPSAQMLALAVHTLANMMASVTLVEGTIEQAPPVPFDGATCLLTLHFLDRAARLDTIKAVRARLKPGAPFVVAHSSFPTHEPARTLWLSRYAAFARAAGADEPMIEVALERVRASLEVMDPEEDESLLREAGFSDVTPFYHAFTWRGWVGYAAE
jgi:tRNA (cmo5U34)-methyltransferase